jgi:chemotaxis protein MotB
MARQSIHNRRAGRGSRGGGASWISYSDMMAALLLIFVLILAYSLYQYFTMLEAKTAEVEAQRLLLVSREEELGTLQTTLQGKQKELDEANAALLTREEALALLQAEPLAAASSAGEAEALVAVSEAASEEAASEEEVPVDTSDNISQRQYNS